MNQMEAFKWEQKRIASSMKEREKEQLAEAEERLRREEQQKQEMSRSRKEEEMARERELGELEALVHREAMRGGSWVDTNAKPSHSSSSATTATPISTSLSSSTGSDSSTEQARPSNSTMVSLKPSESPANETTSTQRPTTRSEQSESIYVSITRRLAALEGNSSLIARYIEEQGKVIRSALAVLEKDWDEWRLARDAEDRDRWTQDRMRQEDRLGKLASQLERQRVLLEEDRKATAAQFRALSAEVGSSIGIERRYPDNAVDFRTKARSCSNAHYDRCHCVGLGVQKSSI